jgi:DNA-binding XRE family transcriptional regulator
MTVIRTKTPAGEPIVILPEAEFERLRDLAEDTEDAAAHARAVARLAAGEDELLTSAEVDELLAAPAPLAFWRAKRGLSLRELAARVGADRAVLAALEAGEEGGDIRLYRRLAEALRVEIEDLVSGEA